MMVHTNIRTAFSKAFFSLIICYFVDYADTPFEVPQDSNCCTFFLKWPITFVLWLTVPDCRKHSKLTMATFAMCIVWIGLASYAVAMLITIIGT